MSINLMQSIGQQIHLTIAEFAELLSKGWVFNSSTRYYNGSMEFNTLLVAESDLMYSTPVYQPDENEVVEFLASLDEVNEEFEYQLSFSDLQDRSNRVDITYTRQLDTILLEVH